MTQVSPQLSRRMPPWPVWVGSLAVWTFLSVVATWSNLQNASRAGRELGLSDEIVRVLIGTVPWAVSMPLIIWFSARRLVDGGHRWRRVGAILGVCLLWLVAAALLVSMPRSIVADRTYLEQLRLQAGTGKAAFVFEYTSLVLYAALGQAIGFWDRSRQRALQRVDIERHLVEARLANLRMKIEPHFIFNAMNSVAALIRRGNQSAAIKAVIGLSDLMRQALRDDAPGSHDLLDELELIERYLDIEQLRHGERLRVLIEVQPTLRRFPVPVLLLQPVVENAVRHGVAATSHPVTISIRAWRAEDVIHLDVTNDGPRLPADFDQTAAGGLGLSLTRRRVSLTHPRGQVTIGSHEHGVLTRITLPLGEIT